MADPPPLQPAGSADVQVLDKTVKQMLTELLLEIGNPADGPLADNLEQLAGVVGMDLDENGALVVDLILDCAVELPAQVPVYATLAGLLSVETKAFGPQIVEACRERLQAAIDATEHATSRMLVRFAAELANASVLRPESLLELFGAFADCAARVVESDGPKQQGNFFAALALEALLWGGKTLAAKSKQALDALLAKLQDYMESDARPADFDLVRSFAKADRKVNEGGEEQAADIFDACDFTEALFRVVQRQTAEDWRCDAIQKPYLSFQGKLAGATAHPMAVVTVPELFDPAAFPLRMVFRVLDPDIDDMRPADRLVCETHIIDAIELYNFDHEERDETTGAMICKVQESAWRLTGGIQRRRIVPTLPAKLTREQSDKIICETIFSQMFQLPQSPQPLLYYSLLLNHLCKLDRHRAGDFNEFSTMLVFTIECIFEQIVEVDVQCLDIFAEWFAHHLSNCITPWKWEVFDGKASTEVWDWHKWDEVANMPAADPRRLFVTNLLERCVRLAYRERILRVLPEQLHPLLPAPVPEETPFKYEEGSAELAAAEFAPELRKKMIGKVPPKEVIAWLEADILPKLDGDSGKEVVMDVAVHVCLCHGNDPTHLQHMIAKNLPVLQHLGVTDRAYTPRLLKAVTEFWACSSQHLIMTVVRLLSMRIVASPAALINFVFDEANLPALEKPTWWEVLRITLSKTVARSQQVEDDLAAARAELAAAPIEVGSSGAVRMQEDEDEDEDSAIAASLEEDTDRADADEMRTDAGAHGRVSETKMLQEKVRRVEAALETVLAEQKEMLLILYQRFCIVLNSHLTMCDASGEDPHTMVFLRTLGHFKEFSRIYRPQISAFMTTLDAVVFNADSIDARINDVFLKIKQTPHRYLLSG